MDVGPVNAAGLRGTLAARDFAPGDTIIAVPFNLTVAVGGHNTLASARFRRPVLASSRGTQLACSARAQERPAVWLYRAVSGQQRAGRALPLTASDPRAGAGAGGGAAAAAPAAAGPLGRPGALLAQPAAGRHAVLQGAGAAAPRRRAAGRRAGAPAACAQRAGLPTVLASRGAWVLMRVFLSAGAALQS